ncbi:MAG: tRNA (guanosine(37)-N1)-methyltransferase TrmD [Pseudomonadota bacterium]
MDLRVVTLFPKMLDLFGKYGVTGRAVEAGRVRLSGINPRDFADDLHGTVDDRPYGGGPGMVMKVQPLEKAWCAAKQGLAGDYQTVILSPEGRSFDAGVARKLAKLDGLILICGRYEGIDQRFYELTQAEVVSLGDFVLSGGELAALVVADSVVRLLPGVLGDDESANQDSFCAGLLDYPHYTRPESFEGQQVPDVLLSGDHGAIARWRLKQALGRTWRLRPDLLAGRTLSDEEQVLLDQYKLEFEQNSSE